MCHGLPSMRTESIVGWIVFFFIATSFWITLIVPESYSPEHNPPRAPAKVANTGPVKLAIFCQERSGSTWLTAMLNKNDRVNVLAEPLHPLVTKHKDLPDKAEAARAEYQLLVDAMDVAGQDKSLRLVGFNEKLIYPKYAMPRQPIILKKMSDYFVKEDFRVVFLLRKNIVFQAVSMIRAVQLANRCGSDGWSKTHEKGWQEMCGIHHAALMKEPLSLNDLKENILRAHKKNDELLKTLKEFNRPYITIYYEDMHENPKQVMNRISEFTGVQLEVKDTLFVKQGNVDIRKSVPNIDDVLRFLGKWNACLVDQVKHFNPLQFCSSLDSTKFYAFE